MRMSRALYLGIAVGLAVTSCAGAGPVASDPVRLPEATIPEPVAIQTSALVRFDECESFLDYVISHAVEIVGPYGLDAGPVWGWDAARAVTEEATADDSAGGDGDGGFSGTNVQVEGVDEPDIVKTDGERIVVIAEGSLIVVDATGDEPVETGRMGLANLAVHSLFLSGDRVLMFGSVWSQSPMPLPAEDRLIAPVPASPTTRIVEVDISDVPEVVRTMQVDGAFVSGRMVDESVRLVVTSGPVGFEWSYPSGSGLRAERKAIEENQAIVRESSADNWIPYYVVNDADGEVRSEGTLFECDRASHPDEFSGLEMLSVVTVDIGAGLEVLDATGILAAGDTVYASEESLYVATQNWQTWQWLQTRDESDAPDGPVTDVHLFDVSDPKRTDYTASGSVDGYLLNQFSMDEHEGMLRVASTMAPSGWGGGSDSESQVTILRPIGDALVRIGRVGGLGETEQIYSVRFMGDVGYVVTFRQTDPLYILDLSDPRAPKLTGELKIPGYSAYLHP
ncbi:MAG: beta-propeller domain-containing protein, partial [Acidimicrobiia bacterium]